MSKPMNTQEQVLVTPVCGVLYVDEGVYAKTRGVLSDFFGPIAIESPAYPFTWSKYYDEEMGGGITRRFLAFKEAREASTLADWKNATIMLERRFGNFDADGKLKRAVNLDPGYIRDNSLILASTKRNVQRVYLRDGIFAEATLFYRDGRWNPFETTFPDFRSGTYDGFLDDARKLHMAAGSELDKAKV
ncbi:MAG: DUF4416 family protein [Planctomycetes bacterium]|nr:DUF4416 family protein [Planctomycetota bacterium]NUQ34243.1 DUF4416 family protein [Planctomycetaceae bacterium]